MDAEFAAKLATLGIPRDMWDRARVEEHHSDPPWANPERPDFIFRLTGVDYQPPISQFPSASLVQPSGTLPIIFTSSEGTPFEVYPVAPQGGITPMFPGQLIVGHEARPDFEKHLGRYWPTTQADGTPICLVEPFLAVWCVEVVPYGSAVTGEMRWHPDRRPKHSIMWEEGNYKKGDVERVINGFEIWLEGTVALGPPRGGRPDGTTTLNEVEFRDRAPKERDLFIKENGSPPSREQLASRLCIGLRTLYEYLDRWPGVVP